MSTIYEENGRFLLRILALCLLTMIIVIIIISAAAAAFGKRLCDLSATLPRPSQTSSSGSDIVFKVSGTALTYKSPCYEQRADSRAGESIVI